MGFLLTRRTAATVSAMLLVLASSSAHAQAVIRGVLYDDASGMPIRGTVMLVDPATDAAVVHVLADSTGHFEISAQTGTYQLAAVRDGYTSIVSAPIALVNGERMTIKLPISQDGHPRHNIGVTEHIRPDLTFQRAQNDVRTPLSMTGFASRRAGGTGLQYDHNSLARSGVSTLGEFLQNVPGFRVLDPQSTNSMQMTRSTAMPDLSNTSVGNCHVGWFIDGHRMDMPGRLDAVTDGLGAMQLESIEAIEVFRGLSEMPAEFAEPDLRCGAVAIWSRHA